MGGPRSEQLWLKSWPCSQQEHVGEGASLWAWEGMTRYKPLSSSGCHWWWLN